jgi:hypothetical protein
MGAIRQPSFARLPDDLNDAPQHASFSLRPYIGDEEKRDKMRAVVVAGLTGVAPRDEMEGMIAAQMLACHDTAMGCFRDALNSKLHGRLWHEYLEQTGKLTRAPLPCCSTRSIAIAGRASRKSRSRPLSGHQYARSRRTSKHVRAKILMSKPSDQLLIYHRSNFTRSVIFSSDRVSPRNPLTCAQPVIPGLMCWRKP